MAGKIPTTARGLAKAAMLVGVGLILLRTAGGAFPQLKALPVLGAAFQ